jgi:ATP-dependent DNA helicase RecG
MQICPAAIAKINEIHQRIGSEISCSRIRRGLEQLVKNGKLRQDGTRNGTRSSLL